MTDKIDVGEFDFTEKESGDIPVRPPPFLVDVYKQREDMRSFFGKSLLGIAGVVVFMAMLAAFVVEGEDFERVKEMSNIVLPGLIGLIGSVIGFYFGQTGR